MTAHADDLERLGRRSDNPTFQDIAVLVGAIPARVRRRRCLTYTTADFYLVGGGSYSGVMRQFGVQGGWVRAMGKARPTGQYANEMAGPGAWPETDEDIYTNRANDLDGILRRSRGLEEWQSHQASIFNGPHVWSGDASKQAGAAVDGATKAMQEHQQQLRDARDWCRNAASNIVNVKDTVTTNVAAGQQEIPRLKKQLQRQIKTLTGRFAPLSNENSTKMSLPSKR